MTIDFSQIDCIVSDMDGTFYLGGRLLPGSLRFAEVLEKRGIRLMFMTNNSSRHSQDYADKLNRLGYPATRKDIFTSGQATVEVLEKSKKFSRIDVFGTPSLRETFKESGFELVEENPELVVLGFDTTLDYPKMVRLCNHVSAKIPYWATHPDFVCPIEGGYIPDTGSFIALVEAATGRKPDRVIGKPSPDILRALESKTGTPLQRMVIVGDRLYTDIAAGKNAGVQSILVLSGETHADQVAESEFKPDLVVKGLGELAELIETGS